MASKYENSISFIKQEKIITCPFCYSKLSLYNHSMKCENNHNFDISRKGTITLLKTSNYKDSKIYNTELFGNRRKFIEGDFYQPLYEKIADIINKQFDNNKITIIDMGCGEGTHSLKILEMLKSEYLYYGLDYSKSAVDMASEYNASNRFYFVGDVNRVPLKDQSADLIIDILSPYNHNEIKRLLKHNGVFIKVSPNKQYLKELRESLDIDSYEKASEVEKNLTKNFKNVQKLELKYEIKPNDEEVSHLIKMSPMHNKNVSSIPRKITIDLIIYIVKGENL